MQFCPKAGPEGDGLAAWLPQIRILILFDLASTMAHTLRMEEAAARARGPEPESLTNQQCLPLEWFPSQGWKADRNQPAFWAAR